MSSSLIDWQSEQSHLLLNPKLNCKIKLEDLPSLPGHIWLSTSGTTSQSGLTLVALSKSAMLCSANNVNAHLQVTAVDTWLCSLPQFHVGGMSILARAHLSSSQVEFLQHGQWQVEKFVQEVDEKQVSLCSLVPTQLFDIVQSRLRAPSSLRVVLLGGGSVSERVYAQAIKLGWVLVPTYGMTEACSQVATASLQQLGTSNIPALEILPHWQTRVSEDGRLQLKGDALLTGYAHVENGRAEYVDPLDKGWFSTQDCVEINGDQLSFIQRLSDTVKVSGELVNLHKLQKFWQGLSDLEAYVISRPDERRENEIVIVTTELLAEQVEKAVVEYNKQVMPFERVQQVYSLAELPKTELGKLRRELLAL